ncbi:MAG: tyrosine-type recombinase/integrase [Planctomycetota bacterium]
MTGLRRRELLLLTWGNIQLSKDSAFVRVPSKLAKNSKEAEQPVAAATVVVLQALKDQARPNDNDRVFVSLSRWVNTAALLREDLAVAGIDPTDREGNEICFASLRNSYISFLANSRTPAKVVQKLARHSDPRLTFNTYARSFGASEQQAVKQLPDLTDFAGQFCLARCSPSQDEKVRTSANNGEQKSDVLEPVAAFVVQESIAPRGFEPLLPG